MPRRKTTRKRRTTRKPKTQTKGIVYNPRSGFGPLGKSFIATFNYSETISLDPVAGESADYVFSANGISKPDYNTISNTHQPYGTDQITPFFDHYTIVGSKCVVKMINTNSTTPVYLGVALKDAVSPINTSAKVIRERGGIQMRLLGPISYGTNKGIVSRTYSAKKFHGKANVVGESELRGNTGAISDYANNPTEQAFYHILLAPQNQGDDVYVSTLQVDISYTAVFTEPKVLAAS
jgi:hypothetical protein